MYCRQIPNHFKLNFNTKIHITITSQNTYTSAAATAIPRCVSLHPSGVEALEWIYPLSAVRFLHCMHLRSQI